MPLSDVELRVLGALTEKERTTPEAYPLSTQGLLTACNQKTSRDPVLELHLQEVQDAMQRLRERGLAATGQLPSDRVPKHRHLLANALGLRADEVAVLSVLLLRGPQTPGELRSRTERYQTFSDLAAVEEVLRGLAARGTPLVRDLGRAAGQNQTRWMQTLGGDQARLQPRVRKARGERPGQPSGHATASGREVDGIAGDHPGDDPGGDPGGDPRGDPGGDPRGGVHERLSALEAQVNALRRRMDDLEG